MEKLVDTQFEREKGYFYFCKTEDNGKIAVYKTKTGRKKVRTPNPYKGVIFGVKVSPKEKVKQVYLPKEVIDELKKLTKWIPETISVEPPKIEEFVDVESIKPKKIWACLKCGHSMEAIEGKDASKFRCNKDNAPLREVEVS